MFTGKANAAPADSSTASFSGTVAPSCTVETAFVDSEYDVSGTDGPSGGPTSITQTSAPAMFDCNSDTLNISAVESTTAPTPTNALDLAGVHAFAYTLNADPLLLPNATAPADANGDASITVTSTWTGGEDLLEGDYVASSVVTVTAN
jgi:hypothetical protein